MRTDRPPRCHCNAFVLRYLYNCHVVTLSFSHVGHVVLQLEAWKIVVDVLQDQVDCHESCRGQSFRLYDETEPGRVFKVQPVGALDLNVT